MKTYTWVCLALAAVALAVVGCNKQSSGSSIDTSQLQSSFKSAPPAEQGSADKVVTAVKSGDYSTAVTELKALASNAKLTPEQQQAAKDLMAQVQKMVTDTAAKAGTEATKAADNLKQSLPK